MEISLSIFQAYYFYVISVENLIILLVTQGPTFIIISVSTPHPGPFSQTDKLPCPISSTSLVFLRFPFPLTYSWWSHHSEAPDFLPSFLQWLLFQSLSSPTHFNPFVKLILLKIPCSKLEVAHQVITVKSKLLSLAFKALNKLVLIVSLIFFVVVDLSISFFSSLILFHTCLVLSYIHAFFPVWFFPLCQFLLLPLSDICFYITFLLFKLHTHCLCILHGKFHNSVS